MRRETVMPGRIRARLAASALAVAILIAGGRPADAAPTGYVTMTDGIKIAVFVQFPRGATPGQGSWPAILVFDGYGGGSAPAYSPGFFGNNYAVVHASVRGTGCSGGAFNLFDDRTAMDGYELIEWIARQPWSDRNVGLYGHSYEGLTAFQILELDTPPPHLKAAALSGLISDTYRDIAYPGGIPNIVFPPAWLLALRPALDTGVYPSPGGSGTASGLLAGDMICAENVATRQPPSVTDQAFVGMVSNRTDATWHRAHSLITRVHEVKVPVHIVGSYGDEQVGPAGSGALWEALDVKKRLVLTNGLHSANWQPPEVLDDRVSWLDRWVRGVDNGIDRLPRVKLLFETHRDQEGAMVSNETMTAVDYPIPQTDWRRFYLRAGRTLSEEAPSGLEEPDPYVAGSVRQSWSIQAPTAGGEIASSSGPDEVEYRLPLQSRPMTLAGPAVLTLRAASSAPDTDLFASLIDRAPDGSLTNIQRGMLRASFRALDPYRSVYNGDGEMIRPFHPFSVIEPVVPGRIYTYEIELWPMGHVIRPGHQLVLKISTPPASDSFWGYEPSRPAGVNLVHHDPANASSILLPLVTLDDLGPERACGTLEGMRCVKPLVP